jgi:hypothetical protein
MVAMLLPTESLHLSAFVIQELRREPTKTDGTEIDHEPIDGIGGRDRWINLMRSMLESLFDLPLVITGLAIIVSLCLFAIGGLLLIRRRVLPRLRIHDEDSHFCGAMVCSVMVFYGLALALIAVNVFETYADVSKIISQEASALAVLYRDTSAYPEPIRLPAGEGTARLHL